MPFFDGLDEQVGFLGEIEGLLKIALLHGLVGLGKELARILQRFPIVSRKAQMAELRDSAAEVLL